MHMAFPLGRSRSCVDSVAAVVLVAVSIPGCLRRWRARGKVPVRGKPDVVTPTPGPEEKPAHACDSVHCNQCRRRCPTNDEALIPLEAKTRASQEPPVRGDLTG